MAAREGEWRSEHYQHVRSVAIIGGGVAGVKACESLVTEGFDVTVFEKRSKVGGVWVQGYDGFGLQVPYEAYEFPGWKSPVEYPRFPTGPQVQQYTEKYVEHFKLGPYMRMGTTVTRAERRESTPGWVIHFVGEDGVASSLEVDMLLVCTGMYSHPSIPEMDSMDKFEGKLIHTQDYQDESEGRDKKVVVVGFGKSAQDIALVSSRVSASTTLVYRKPHWPAPRYLLGFVPIKFGVFSRFASTMLPAYMRPSGLERFVHSLGYPLVWGFWRLLELILKLQLSLSACDMVPTEPVENDVFTGGFLPQPDFYPRVKSGQIKGERTSIKEFREKSVVLDNGKEVEADVVVFGTGWRKAYPFFGEDVIEKLGMEEDGHYLYRHMLHPGLPQLAFIGSNVSTFQNLLTQSVQVRWMTDLLRGHMVLPDASEMEQEVKDMKEWKRSFIPNLSSRGALLQLHLLHYHDELLRDMELRTHRKSNPVAEVLMPYAVEDYDGVCFTRDPSELNVEIEGEPRRPASGPSALNWLVIFLALPVVLSLVLGLVLPLVLVFWILSAPFLLRCSSGRPKLPRRAPVYSKEGVNEHVVKAEDVVQVQVVTDDADSDRESAQLVA